MGVERGEQADRAERGECLVPDSQERRREPGSVLTLQVSIFGCMVRYLIARREDGSPVAFSHLKYRYLDVRYGT
jgi:hypothetical protein